MSDKFKPGSFVPMEEWEQYHQWRKREERAQGEIKPGSIIEVVAAPGEKAISALVDYIRNTKHGHYSGGIDFIEYAKSHGLLEHFALGNIIKYATRHPIKGKREDLLKIAHYALVLYQEHE